MTRGGEASRASPAWRQTFSSLSNRDFRYLWVGQLFVMGGMQMLLLAHSYLVYEIKSSAALLGLVTAAFFMPVLVLALYGGAIADRLDRKRIIQAGQTVVALVALLIAVFDTTDSVTWVHLLVASMAVGAAFSFVGPARQAIIPQLVGRQQLNNAMALNAAGVSATTLLAPTVAGLIYATFGADAVYYAVGGLILASVFLTARLPKLTTARESGSATIAGDIMAGLSYVKGSPLIMVLLVMGLFTALLAMPFRFLMPVFVVDVYQRGPGAMGLMVTVLGLGALVGSLFIASLGSWRRGLVLMIGTFVTGVALLMVALLPYYFVALGLMGLLGLGDAARRTLNQALIMEVSEDQYRGRVMSVFMLNFAVMPLGVLPAGLLAEYFGGQVSIGLLAGLLLFTSTLILVTQKRLRDLH